MDAGSPSATPPRRRLLRWHGIVIAALLIGGGACIALGHSGNVAWLERLDWHLNYDTLGVALLWLGSLLMLPPLAYSLWARFGPLRHPTARRLGGLALGAAAALLMLAIAPDHLSISKYHDRDIDAYRYDRDTETAPADPNDGKQDTYTFHGFRGMPWLHFAREHDETAPPERAAWTGPHTSWFGTLDIYRWHPILFDDASALEATGMDQDQPQGYECLERRTRFVGPFTALHTTFIDPHATALNTYPACRRVMRFRGKTMPIDEAMQAYAGDAGATPLARAVAAALAHMGDTVDRPSVGEIELAMWMSTRPLILEELQRLPHTTTYQARQNLSQERAKLACVSGRLVGDVQSWEQLKFGAIRDTSTHMVYRLTVVHSTGKLKDGDTASFCGVVIGKIMLPDDESAQTDSLALVGMFDLPENRQPLAGKP